MVSPSQTKLMIRAEMIRHQKKARFLRAFAKNHYPLTKANACPRKT